jgi:hypothetical protein
MIIESKFMITVNLLTRSNLMLQATNIFYSFTFTLLSNETFFTHSF